jgi:hypothetical protein
MGKSRTSFSAAGCGSLPLALVATPFLCATSGRRPGISGPEMSHYGALFMGWLEPETVPLQACKYKATSSSAAEESRLHTQLECSLLPSRDVNGMS